MRRWQLHRDRAVLQKRGADGWWRTAINALKRPHSPTQPCTQFKLTVVVRVADIERKDGYACQLISGMRVYPVRQSCDLGASSFQLATGVPETLSGDADPQRAARPSLLLSPWVFLGLVPGRSRISIGESDSVHCDGVSSGTSKKVCIASCCARSA